MSEQANQNQTPATTTDTTTDKNKGAEGKSPATDKLIAPQGKKTRLVKMEIQRDTEVFLPDAKKDKDGNLIATIMLKGAVVDLEEEEALRLINKKVPGTYGFSGERDGLAPKQVLRAARPYQAPIEETKHKDPFNPLNFQESVV